MLQAMLLTERWCLLGVQRNRSSNELNFKVYETMSNLGYWQEHITLKVFRLKEISAGRDTRNVNR